MEEEENRVEFISWLKDSYLCRIFFFKCNSVCFPFLMTHDWLETFYSDSKMEEESETEIRLDLLLLLPQMQVRISQVPNGVGREGTLILNRGAAWRIVLLVSLFCLGCWIVEVAWNGKSTIWQSDSEIQLIRNVLPELHEIGPCAADANSNILHDKQLGVIGNNIFRVITLFKIKVKSIPLISITKLVSQLSVPKKGDLPT